MERNFNFIVFLLSLVATIFVCKTYLLNKKLKETESKLAEVEMKFNEANELNEYLKSKDGDSLSEWDMFTLALTKVESGYNPTASSSVGAKGYFQIMPIYVAEVNRVHKTNYVYEEVVASFEQSYEVFTLMQEAHNSEYDMDRALELHNGNHGWYKRRVYKELKEIRRYEEMRQMLKDANLSLIL
jgi:hypothetical protein